jgi:DNA replication protein DnaC
VATAANRITPTNWHEQIGDPTIADSILDRLVHNPYRIELIGESMRKNRNRKLDDGAA